MRRIPIIYVDLGKTEQDEIVEVEREVVECDLVIYVDTIQIPLNGGHKSVAVGMGTYNSIAPHHSPHMTAESPHVMQPDGSNMHDCIERMSRVVQAHSKIMVIEAAMNNQIYPTGFRQLGKPNAQCNGFEKMLKNVNTTYTVTTSGSLCDTKSSKASERIMSRLRSTPVPLTMCIPKPLKR